MLWIFLFSAIGLAMLYNLQIRPKNTGLLLAVASDDSDMKIVPPFGAASVPEDDGEKAAREFVVQKENGNIDKAYGLGNRIADVFFDENGLFSVSDETELQPLVLLQKKILFAFVADAVLGAELPSVLAETASQQFSARMQGADSDLFDKVNDPKTLSYYLLCTKKGRSQFESIGKAFAQLCCEEESGNLRALGESLHREYTDACKKMIKDTHFV